MPTLKLGDIEQHHERTGSPSGPPVLLLAGMASDSASWQPLFDGLGARFDLIAPDNRCTGRTLPALSPTSRDAMVDDALALLDALEIERAAVVGHSMGAMLGWALAARAPERVSRLVAMAAAPSLAPVRVELFTTLARLRRTADEADFFRLLFQFLFSPSLFERRATLDAMVVGATGYAHKQSAEAFALQADGLPSFLEPPAIERVGCPVLALAGERDLLATPDSLRLAYRDLPHVRVRSVADAAHALHWENPQGVLDAVVPFLSGGA